MSLTASFKSCAAALLLTLGVGSTLAAESLKVGYLPVTGQAKFFVAKEYGIFEKEGLDVELIEFQNSADGLNALVSGKLDIAPFGTTAPLVFLSKGSKIRIIGGIMGGDAALIATPEKAPGVSRIADLKGKKVATVRLASGDAVLRGALKEAGLNPKTDLELFELKNPPAVIEAVKSGQVDAGVVWGPHDLRAEDQGLKVVIRSTDLQPGHPCCRILAMDTTIEKNPATLEKFVRAILLAQKYGVEHKKETVAAIAKYVKLDPALLEKAYTSPYLDQSSDPNTKGVTDFANIMVESEFITAVPDLKTGIYTEIYQRALNQLAKENPDDPFWKTLQEEFKKNNS
ncbi:ABC transporter substrate-binding protein [Betaproteobacteria bacterium]|nr:ABC transporter substrate-binding protein [Betaproteobacteria bacterium]GHU03471.1 ABC transporter substrate-binding protein [Betaproteobacteria bacterium]GHU20927.1 ABC transporter substrate-binding protein [Betaproteobacteria bacterium]